MESTVSHEETLEIIRKNGNSQKDVLSILLELQYASPQGYIDRETAGLVGRELGITETKMYEIITFYSMLKEKPQAKHVLKICNSSPCHFSKSQEIINVLEEELEIKIGEISKDGMFAFHYIPCVGACDIGPVIKIKDTLHGNLDSSKIKHLIEDLRSGKIEQ